MTHSRASEWLAEPRALTLCVLLASEQAVSTSRAAKTLGLSMSQLQRLLTVLGDDASFGGLGLVEMQRDGDRVLLRLTDKGRALCRGG